MTTVFLKMCEEELLFYTVANQALEHYKNELVSSDKNTQILEIGGGPRTMIPELLSTNASVIGIDLSMNGLKQAQNKTPHASNAHFIAMNAEHTAFVNQSFDLICGTAVLHHLDLFQACSEIKRLLKPQGKAVFLEPLGHNPLFNLFRMMTPKIRTLNEKPMRLCDFDIIHKNFSHCKITPYCMFNLIASPFYRFGFFNKLRAALTRVDQFIFQDDKINGINKHAWLCVIEIKL